LNTDSVVITSRTSNVICNAQLEGQRFPAETVELLPGSPARFVTLFSPFSCHSPDTFLAYPISDLDAWDSDTSPLPQTPSMIQPIFRLAEPEGH
jgi:hypothetical protein